MRERVLRGGTAHVVLFLVRKDPILLPAIELLLSAALLTFIGRPVRIMMRSGIGNPPQRLPRTSQ